LTTTQPRGGRWNRSAKHGHDYRFELIADMCRSSSQAEVIHGVLDGDAVGGFKPTDGAGQAWMGDEAEVFCYCGDDAETAVPCEECPERL
jgi:hypothetical protein